MPQTLNRRGRDQGRGLSYFHDLRRGGATPAQPSKARQKTLSEAYPNPHGQKGNRISEAHRQVPDLDYWIHDCGVRLDRPLRVENFLARGGQN